MMIVTTTWCGIWSEDWEMRAVLDECRVFWKLEGEGETCWINAEYLGSRREREIHVGQPFGLEV